ncbi:hypothetical protein B0J13DRAFT_158963 [Dactylonectria estremocensis]|uniref:Zn(2)-C6 fungal-type domain-containing protein n=1 Tax=Dactylonectria estremocensis TaxID=1079267 RepID=A0A9P9IIW3_9HYPO|nr:hypothetical protein B0J13DRAFT_158963 [Dactylonectria estremocensis]
MMSGTPSKTKTACDQCRFRKLRCDGGFPCGRCSKLEFECSFNTKTSRNRRIEQLREQRSQLPPPSASFHEHEPEHEHDGGQSPMLVDDESDRQESTDLGSKLGDGVACSLPASDDCLSHVSPPLSQSIALQGSHPSLVTESRSVAAIPGSMSFDQHDPEVPPLRDAIASLHAGSPYDAPSHPSTDAVVTGSTLVPREFPVLEHGSFSPSSSRPAACRRCIAFDESEVLPWLNIFFDRLYSTLPIVNHLAVYQDVMNGRQDTDANFATMILSLCALALIQPVFKAEYSSMPTRTALATKMLRSALQARDFDFGENITLEAVVASFFMFAALYGLDRPKAAWLRLREAVEGGQLIGLHQPETYQGLSADEKSQRFRLFLILAVTERGYALQRNHYISFIGQHMEKMNDVYKAISANATRKISNILIHDSRNVTAMQGLLQLMRLFDSVDEDVIPCWNRSCSPPLTSCAKLTVDRAHKVYDAIANAMKFGSRQDGDDADMSSFFTTISPVSGSPTPELNDMQWADCFVLQQWLLIRLWVSCLTHDLLNEDSELTFIRPSFSVVIAENVLQQCQRLDASVLEVHGIGMVERIHDIALGVVMAIQHCRDTDGDPTTHRGHATLQRYFTLLQRLRNGEHSFTLALREAYESTGI